MKVLVTGGAGYIGSHVVLQLGVAGHEVVVLDNLSTGHAWAVLHGRFVQGDLADRGLLERLFAAHRFDAVLHLAASIVVPESVREPLRYYRNNTANTIALLELCQRHDVERFVFSSTAAVYGWPQSGRVDEQAPVAPISPYGASKAMSERILADTAAATGLRYVILRYFNVAGADPQTRIGEATVPTSHLIKIACETALGLRRSMAIYGTDYETPDGTCIRDYLHVDDLARAHLDALDYLADGGGSTVLNCGYGRGHSVREVLQAVHRVSRRTVPALEHPRRPGDPAQIIAEPGAIRRVLGWRPKHDDLEYIVDTAWRWEARYAGARHSNA